MAKPERYNTGTETGTPGTGSEPSTVTGGVSTPDKTGNKVLHIGKTQIIIRPEGTMMTKPKEGKPGSPYHVTSALVVRGNVKRSDFGDACEIPILDMAQIYQFLAENRDFVNQLIEVEKNKISGIPKI